MKYMKFLTEKVEREISEELPSAFSLVLDGCSSDSTHHLTIFASFLKNSSFSSTVRLLWFSPLSDECCLDPQEHIDFIEFVMDLFNKSMANVMPIIGDNCSLNKSIAQKTGIPLIGCAFHVFNLAVSKILCHKEQVVGKIQH